MDGIGKIAIRLCLYGHILPQLQHSLAGNFPSLKNLKMDLDFVDLSLLNVFLSYCPILETLEASMKTQTLTALCMPNSLKMLKFTVENRLGACIRLDACYLKYLGLTRVTFEESAIGNLHIVEEAKLDVFSLNGIAVVVNNPLVSLLQALSGIKHLVLGFSTTKWLLDSSLESLEFRHLLRLEINLLDFKMNFMFLMLQKCPMLEAIIIEKKKNALHEELYEEDEDAPLLEIVPICLLNHLTSFQFKGYGGHVTEQRFAKYVFQNRLVLRTMIFSNLSLSTKWEKYEVERTFSETPKGFVNCQVTFD